MAKVFESDEDKTKQWLVEHNISLIGYKKDRIFEPYQHIINVKAGISRRDFLEQMHSSFQPYYEL